MIQATDMDIQEIRTLILGLDKKLEIHMVQTTERFNNIDTQFKNTDTQLTDIRTQLRSQDTRLWGFIVTLVIGLVGILSKFAFFPPQS